MITAEQIEKIRKSGLVAIAGVSVSDILDSLDACETERDRLRTEVARLREIALSDDVRGMLSSHGSDGTILVVGEFSSGREFCEKFRLSAQGVEVPEFHLGILEELFIEEGPCSAHTPKQGFEMGAKAVSAWYLRNLTTPTPGAQA